MGLGVGVAMGADEGRSCVEAATWAKANETEKKKINSMTDCFFMRMIREVLRLLADGCSDCTPWMQVRGSSDQSKTKSKIGRLQV